MRTDILKKQDGRERCIYRVTWVGFFVNVLLTIFKLLAGIAGRSGAMMADAIHSLSDFATDLVVLLFVRLSSKPKDTTHDYGHGKYETLATVIIGIALFAVAMGIMAKGVKDILDVIGGTTLPSPEPIALYAAIISIAAKEMLYHYTLAVARKTDSDALKANAWHHRSDALSSIGTLAGIGGALLLGDRWTVLDPIAAVAVGVMILKVAYDLVMPGMNELLESSLPADVEEEITAIVLADERLSDLHNLKTRKIGACIAAEFHVRVRPDMSVEEAHRLTREAEHRLKLRFGANAHITVHIEPLAQQEASE